MVAGTGGGFYGRGPEGRVVSQFDRMAGLPVQSLRLASVPRECFPDLIGARDGVRRADFDDECGCSLPEEEKAARAPPSRAPHAAEQATCPSPAGSTAGERRARPGGCRAPPS